MEKPTHYTAPLSPPREDIRRRIQVFGYAHVAEAAGIRAYQTVSNFCEGKNVHESTKIRILATLEKLEAEHLHQQRQQSNLATEEGFRTVSLPQFNDLRRQVEQLSAQLAMLMKTQLAAHQWVGSQKAADILNCSPITLHRRKQAGELEYRKNGSRVEYNIEGLMQYLEARHVKPDTIQERVLGALAV